MRNKKGFTLIELLIVIAIIGLLATLAIISLTTAQRKARDTKRVADIKSLQSAVELFYSDQAAYPDPATWAAFASDTVANGGVGNYITQLPTPPSTTAGDSYYYLHNAANSAYVLCAARIEDEGHQALDQDSDTDIVAGDAYEGVSMAGGGTASAHASGYALTCADDGTSPDPYCLTD